MLFGGLMFLNFTNSYAQISSDFDHNVDFSQFKTYNFEPGTFINEGKTQEADALLEQKVESAVSAQLNAKGLKQTSSNPDLIISYTAGAQRKTEIESAPGFAGPGIYGGGWYVDSYDTFWTNTYTEGTLIIDVNDAKSDELVYRVYGAGEMKKPEKRQKQIDKVAEKGFKDFPAKD